MAGARCTSLLVGEYGRQYLAEGAEFAVADGIIFLNMTDRYGERQRMVEVLKLRGHAVDLRPYPFLISDAGIRVLGLETDIGCHTPETAQPVPTGIDVLEMGEVRPRFQLTIHKARGMLIRHNSAELTLIPGQGVACGQLSPED